MMHSSSLKASISSASKKKNPGILLNHKFHHRFHKSLLPVSVLSQINPFPPSWFLRSILILFFHLHPYFPSRLFTRDFSTKILHMPFLSSICATRHINTIIYVCVCVFECNSRSALGDVGVPTKYKEESVGIYNEKHEIYDLNTLPSGGSFN